MADSFTATGGWCAPLSLTTRHHVEVPRIELPIAQAARGGISFDPPTPAERLAREAVAAWVRRAAAAVAAAQDAAIDLACAIALDHGYDVEVVRLDYPPSDWNTLDHGPYPFFGLAVVERKHRRTIPTLHERRVSPYDDAEVWDDYPEED